MWCFVREYRDVLGIPNDVAFPLDRISLFDETAAPSSESPNVYQFLIQFLLVEEAKHSISLRKEMRDVKWLKSGLFGCKRFVGLCDSVNFPSFIRGYFDKHCFDVADTRDPKQLMIYVLLHLMRCPDCFIFLRPVDEERNNVPGYKETVKTPMDFQTICQRVIAGWYDGKGEESVTRDEGEESVTRDERAENGTRGEGLVGVVRDIYLIYANCRLFNPSDSSAYRYCQKMMALTEMLLKQWVAACRVRQQ